MVARKPRLSAAGGWLILIGASFAVILGYLRVTDRQHYMVERNYLASLKGAQPTPCGEIAVNLSANFREGLARRAAYPLILHLTHQGYSS
jgi:hypothetical protein